MELFNAAKIWINYHKNRSKKNTVRAYVAIICPFCQEIGDIELDQITPDDVLSFLNRLTNGNKTYTKRVRYSHLSSF